MLCSKYGNLRPYACFILKKTIAGDALQLTYRSVIWTGYRLTPGYLIDCLAPAIQVEFGDGYGARDVFESGQASWFVSY